MDKKTEKKCDILKHSTPFRIFKKILILAELWTKTWENMHFNDILIWKCRFSIRTSEYFLEIKLQNELKVWFLIKKLWTTQYSFGFFKKILNFNRVLNKKLRKNILQRHFYMEVSVFNPDLRVFLRNWNIDFLHILDNYKKLQTQT